MVDGHLRRRSDPKNADCVTMGARLLGARFTRSIPAAAITNFMMDDEGEERLTAAFGENHKRLGEVKKNTIPPICSG